MIKKAFVLGFGFCFAFQSNSICDTFTSRTLSVWKEHYLPFMREDAPQWVIPHECGIQGNSPLACSTVTIALISPEGDEVCLGRVGLLAEDRLSSESRCRVARIVVDELKSRYYYAVSVPSMEPPISLSELRAAKRALKASESATTREVFLQNVQYNERILRIIRSQFPRVTGVYLEIVPVVTDWY